VCSCNDSSKALRMLKTPFMHFVGQLPPTYGLRWSSTMVARLPALHPPPPPPPLALSPPSAVTTGVPPAPLLPHPSPLLLVVDRATPWPASPPLPLPLALKVTGSQFTDSTTGSGSPSTRSVVASCSRHRAASCHGHTGCATFGRWWPLDVAPAMPDLAAPSPVAARSASPITDLAAAPCRWTSRAGGSCLAVHGPRRHCHACWWPTPRRPSPQRRSSMAAQ
jgi:hypothetical protein